MKSKAASLMGCGWLTLALAACGGGGGGGGSNFVSVPPAPTPTPSPPPQPPFGSSAVAILPSITTSTEFAVLGRELSNSGLGLFTDDGFAVSYDAARNVYVFALPFSTPRDFHASANGQGNPSYWDGGLLTANGTLWPPMSVLKASPQNPIVQLQYTSFAQYLQAGPMEDLPHGVVAFGVATPGSAVPTSGSATMNGVLAGYSVDQLAYVTGTASFSFNFAAGTLAGSLLPTLHHTGDQESYLLGRYNFVDTIYSVGSPTFSGKLRHESNNLLGAFHGRFTGPQAQELMARWDAEYADPKNGQTKQMFGVAVGKRQ